MDSSHEIQFSSSLPYPPVNVDRKNQVYARAMLENMGGTDSELTAISMYFYNNLITSSFPDVPMVFHKIMIVEMHHLELFGQLAAQLGEDPRFWTQKGSRKTYWSPSYAAYAGDVRSLLKNAMNHENGAVAKYQSQMQQIKDENVIKILERIVIDEKLHIEIFQLLFDQYCK